VEVEDDDVEVEVDDVMVEVVVLAGLIKSQPLKYIIAEPTAIRDKKTSLFLSKPNTPKDKWTPDNSITIIHPVFNSPI
jgi:hypothetical protein